VPDLVQAQFPPDAVDQLVAAANALSAAMGVPLLSVLGW
jgi:hypothetical protein